MRVAIGGLSHESVTFSPLLTRLDDFRILRGEALGASYPFMDEWTEVTFVPMMRARALPGGTIDPAAYEKLETEFLAADVAIRPLLPNVSNTDFEFLKAHERYLALLRILS